MKFSDYIDCGDEVISVVEEKQFPYPYDWPYQVFIIFTKAGRFFKFYYNSKPDCNEGEDYRGFWCEEFLPEMKELGM